MTETLCQALADFYRAVQNMRGNSLTQPCHFPKNGNPDVFRDDYFRDQYLHWHIITLNDMDDFYFVDEHEAAQGFPVYFSQHDDDWDKSMSVLPSLAEFAAILLKLDELEYLGSEKAADFIAQTQDINHNKFWRELQQNYRELTKLQQEWAQQEAHRQAKIASGDWVRGDIVITDLGDAKMKVAARMKQWHQLSAAEVLNMMQQPEIIYCSGLWEYMRPHLEELHSWGVTAEFVPTV